MHFTLRSFPPSLRPSPFVFLSPLFNSSYTQTFSSSSISTLFTPCFPPFPNVPSPSTSQLSSPPFSLPRVYLLHTFSTSTFTPLSTITTSFSTSPRPPPPPTLSSINISRVSLSYLSLDERLHVIKGKSGGVLRHGREGKHAGKNAHLTCPRRPVEEV